MKQKITIFLLALVIIFSLCSSCVIVLPEYSKGLEFLSNGDGTCCVSGLGTCTDIEISIPTTSPVGDRVTGIGGGAFANCDDISSITIPKSVTNIGFCAFKNCTKLTNVIFPDDGSIAVGWGAFENCGNLPYTIYNGAKYLACKNNPCFLLLIADEEGKSPTSFTVLPQTKWIAFGAFIECRKLENITIPKGVTCIGGATFTECDSLTSISVEIDNSKYHS